MAKLSSPAHLAISLAVSLTLLAQLLLVHTSGPQFLALAITPVAMVIAVVVAIAGVDLNASRPNLDILRKRMKSALGVYSPGDREKTGIDEAEAVRVLMEKYEIVKAMFRPGTKGGFDYHPALDASATPQARLAIMAGAIDWVLTLQQEDAAKETTDEAKKRVRRRYADAVTALSNAFALAGASDEARAIRDEVGFFQAIQAALAKSVPGDGKRSSVERELAIQQIVSAAL